MERFDCFMTIESLSLVVQEILTRVITIRNGYIEEKIDDDKKFLEEVKNELTQIKPSESDPDRTFLHCPFCGQTSPPEHSVACPIFVMEAAIDASEKRNKSDFVVLEIFSSAIERWARGFEAGYGKGGCPSGLIGSVFMLGYGRGLSEKLRNAGGDTDVLHSHTHEGRIPIQ